jgi:restriction system protein
MLGRKSVHAKVCLEGNFIGTDFGIHQDLSTKLPEAWRAFNREFIPIYLQRHPDKSKVAAGLACGALWTVSKGIDKGDIVLCPDGERHYYVGEVVSDYTYQPDGVLPHRRAVQWFTQMIDRPDMSEALRNSTGSIMTVCDITRHSSEIETLLGITSTPALIANDDTIKDAYAFVMEEHLEAFLVQNWAQSDFAREYEYLPRRR